MEFVCIQCHSRPRGLSEGWLSEWRCCVIERVCCLLVLDSVSIHKPLPYRAGSELMYTHIHTHTHTQSSSPPSASLQHREQAQSRPKRMIPQPLVSWISL